MAAAASCGAGASRSTPRAVLPAGMANYTPPLPSAPAAAVVRCLQCEPGMQTRVISSRGNNHCMRAWGGPAPFSPLVCSTRGLLSGACRHRMDSNRHGGGASRWHRAFVAMCLQVQQRRFGTGTVACGKTPTADCSVAGQTIDLSVYPPSHQRSCNACAQWNSRSSRPPCHMTADWRVRRVRRALAFWQASGSSSVRHLQTGKRAEQAGRTPTYIHAHTAVHCLNAWNAVRLPRSISHGVWTWLVISIFSYIHREARTDTQSNHLQPANDDIIIFIGKETLHESPHRPRSLPVCTAADTTTESALTAGMLWVRARVCFMCASSGAAIRSPSTMPVCRLNNNCSPHELPRVHREEHAR